MNIICKYFCTGSPLALMLSGVLLFGNASAHTYTTLNEYQIDRANETASTSVLQLQVFLSDMFKQKYMADRWPDLKLSAMRDDMMHQIEEAEMGIEYFLSTGLNTQSAPVLLLNPVAGRTVAANQLVQTSYDLIKYMETLENQQAFIKEIYTGGKAAYMYNLMTSQREKMDIYRTLFNVMPSPPGTPGASTLVIAPVAETAAMPVLLYLFGGLGFCALVTMILKPEKSRESEGVA